MKKRINISIDAELHKRAQAYARDSKYTDFSSLLSELLVEKMREDLALERAVERATQRIGAERASFANSRRSGGAVADLRTHKKARGGSNGSHPKREKSGRAPAATEK